jgi:hypothetical protein
VPSVARPSLAFGEALAPDEVLFFEAFVTGAAKGEDHTDDALAAAEEARRLLASSPRPSPPSTSPPF